MALLMYQQWVMQQQMVSVPVRLRLANAIVTNKVLQPRKLMLSAASGPFPASFAACCSILDD